MKTGTISGEFCTIRMILYIAEPALRIEKRLKPLEGRLETQLFLDLLNDPVDCDNLPRLFGW
jgi:hypothetical protein